ncbi:MAG: hypothetical protein PHE18_01580 [Candidatus Omnitrophica bacterium]|nr:hypothetical protein [Candidatus Omnitrophota bacterium]MDD5552545.1 hypothetical protein [Candidatus Omnitrophota bacterium]
MAEYSILIALVIAAAIGIKVYVQRGIQARIHDESDEMFNAVKDADWSQISTVAVTANKQFEPSDFSKKTTTQTVQDTEDYTLEKEGTTAQTSTKTTKQAAGDYEQYNKPTEQ